MLNVNLVDRLDRFRLHFRECTPRVLVITDGGLDKEDGPFGLNHFLDVLSATAVHGMLPDVVHRARDAGGTDNAFVDLSASKFDVVFLFGVTGASSALSAAALTKVKQFMQDGGGLFATGDHEDLGAGMSGQIPRVRSMRYWAADETPNIRDSTRLTTNLPGTDRTYRFNDQADAHPQRLYPNFAVGNEDLVFAPPGGVSPVEQPHPLLRLADGSALDVYPDHPHEGECRIPSDFSATFDLNGTKQSEWPGPFFFNPARPRAVAYAMSAGNGFTDFGGKSAVVPRSFITIAAYNGQHSKVGRVVTDSTWHHYVNINLDGMRPNEVSNGDMQSIERYWANLVNWLMPAKVRSCLWPWLVIATLAHHPFLEEIEIPEPGIRRPRDLEALGAAVVQAVDEQPGSVGSDVVADALALLVAENDRSTGKSDDEIRPNSRVISSVGHALVGAHVADLVNSISTEEESRGRIELAGIVESLGRDVVDAIVEDEHAAIERAEQELDSTRRLLAPR